ncbi:hypothetical protein [Pleomorphomonas oryzae]|uniref:hypothetical protein n=1 Tax=Pleomorphomonas oryzae TaxID=261934 RepID=UPI0012EBB63C|nr:hypothetical protein [Pleomorphomonas oryzae]
MKGFLAGIAVTILMLAAFPSLGHWAMAMPYRAFATFGPATSAVPAGWQGIGRGGRTAYGCPRAMAASYGE